MVVAALRYSFQRLTLIRASRALAASALVLTGAAAQAQTKPDAVAQFYTSKTLYVIAGDGVGGGYDAYARLVARHLGKYIPGNPSVVVQNLAGGGSLLAGERIAVSAPQDGTYIAAIHPTVLLDPIMGDPRKGVKRLEFAYLGSAAKNLSACYARSDAPVHSFADAFNTPFIVGAGNDASSTREFAGLLKSVLGVKLQVSSGYTGNGEIYLAIDRGEVQGACGIGVSSIAALRPNWFKTGFIKAIAQESNHGDPALNAQHVPLVASFAKTDEQRQILSVYYSQQEFGRPFVVSTKTPADRLAALQTAFMDVFKDPEFLHDAQVTNLDVSAVPGAEMKTLVDQAYATSPDTLAKLRQALGY